MSGDKVGVPVGRDGENGHVGQPARQVLEEQQARRVGPLKIFQHEEERTLSGKPPDEV